MLRTHVHATLTRKRCKIAGESILVRGQECRAPQRRQAADNDLGFIDLQVLKASFACFRVAASKPQALGMALAW
jgi:hypothetical protein